jgi:hypothetical protein
MPKQTTPAQHFKKIFERWINGSTQGERESAEDKVNKWLKRHGKTRSDISAILAQVAADDAAAQPPPPQSDPRDDAVHPFDDPKFTPVGLVKGIFEQYVRMDEHTALIFSLWICFTHVYTRFNIAPRIALISEDPDSGKTTALEIARRLVFRPNPETLGTGAAITDFLDQGPGTVLLDELDQVDADARRKLQLMWNIGHKRGAKISLQLKGRRKLISIYAPMLAAGVGSFLAPTQKSRTFSLEMEPYTQETKPEREYDEDDVEDLNSVYSFLRHWAAIVKLEPRPSMPPGVLRRSADNIRGILSIADSCGPEWGQRARETVIALFEKEKAERPQMTLIRHGLIIFEMLELDQIGSIQFNKELRQLDLPDARWTRYRGPGGTDYAHPLELHEQSTLLRKVGIQSMPCWPSGKRQRGGGFRGYKLAQFEEAQRKFNIASDAEPKRGHLRDSSPPPRISRHTRWTSSCRIPFHRRMASVWTQNRDRHFHERL